MSVFYLREEDGKECTATFPPGLGRVQRRICHENGSSDYFTVSRLGLTGISVVVTIERGVYYLLWELSLLMQYWTKSFGENHEVSLSLLEASSGISSGLDWKPEIRSRIIRWVTGCTGSFEICPATHLKNRTMLEQPTDLSTRRSVPRNLGCRA